MSPIHNLALRPFVDVISLYVPVLGGRYHGPHFVDGRSEVQRIQAPWPRLSPCRGQSYDSSPDVLAAIAFSLTQHSVRQRRDVAHKMSLVRPTCSPAFKFGNDHFRASLLQGWIQVDEEGTARQGG